mmetsp:Transcript_29725/g.58894  ORF Transcript_29725/g.58894 Transcript_29725/m.58894 type:complete len:86 (+) Transcript_29725:646-903(+)
MHQESGGPGRGTASELTNGRHTIYLRAKPEKRPVSAFARGTHTRPHGHVGATTPSAEGKEASDKIANRHAPSLSIDPAAKSSVNL